MVNGETRWGVTALCCDETVTGAGAGASRWNKEYQRGTLNVACLDHPSKVCPLLSSSLLAARCCDFLPSSFPSAVLLPA